MKKSKSNKTCRGHISTKILGVSLLTLLILVNIACASPFAYITNSGSDSISIIDTATDTVTGILDIGSGPLGVAVTPDGTKVYVANSGDETVSVIDTATNEVIKTIFNTQQAYGVAVSSDGKKAYVAGYNLYIIDTATNDITASVGGIGYNARSIVVTPDGKKAYVTCEGLDPFNPASIVYVIDTARNKVIKKIDVGKDPIGAAVSPDGKKVYISSRGTVSIIDTTTDKIIAVVDIGYTPYLTGIAVNPQGTTAYVANPYDKTVSVIDTVANKVTGRVPVGTEPRGISVTPDGTKVYVANSGDGTVSVIDTATNTVKGVIDVEVSPQAFGQFIAPSGKLVLPVANFTSYPTSGYVPLTVKFTDSSKNATEWNWDFGDGDTSTEQNPTHTYSTAGNYTLNLMVSNGNGTSSKSTTISVIDKIPPVADFSSNTTKGYVPLTVQFTDHSTNAAKWNWDFGDGAKSTEQNPVHTYYTKENYTVRLTVTNKFGQNSKTIGMMVIDGSPTYAYISNSGDNTVSVIDTNTSTVIATISVGQSPFGVAVSSDGTKAYVANYGSDTVSVINTVTNTVTATVSVGDSPYGVAVSPDGKKVYVTNSGGFQVSGTVSVIDTATNKVKGTILVEENPRGIAVGPDGKNVYVANYGDSNPLSPGNTVSVIDTATNKVTATVPVGSGPEGVVVSPDGKKVYVTILRVFDYNHPKSVYVIDTATNSVTATVEAGIVPSSGVAINPTGTKIYSTDIGYNIVYVIDTKTNKVTAKVPAGSGPEGVAITPDGKSVYVANKDDNSVSIIDTVTNTVKATIDVGKSPIAVGKFIGSLPTFKPVLPVANFSAKPTSGNAPLTVVFSDTSTGAPTAWKWSFGDGTNSTQQNPTYKYSKTGKYTVDLTVTNAAGSNTVTKTDCITVVEKPVANFSASLTSGKAPLTVTFIDKSTGSLTKWKWSFGDGATSTKQNITHKYTAVGKYTVSLTVTNAAGSNTKTVSNYITVVEKPVAAFSASPTSGKAPLNVKFTDTSTGSPTKWKWTFGDGATSTKQNTTHKYTAAGKYTVSLTVTNAAGSNTKTVSNYITVKK